MNLNGFFAKHPVFTAKELAEFHAREGSRSQWTRKALLAHHQKQGHILRIRRGLYAAVPPGADPDRAPVNPFLVAAKLADDAVLAYHTALEFHGKAYSVSNRYQYQTATAARPFVFRTYRFEPVQLPKALRDKRRGQFAVRTEEREGLDVRVASLERTLVDVLDRPALAGGWEEIWRSLEAVEFFDLDVVVKYALLLDNATTAAKVGFFLDQHREPLMVEDRHLESLRKSRPKRPHYIDRDRTTPARLVSDWNLIVPQRVLVKSWQEAP